MHNKTEPQKQVDDWNEKYPVGTKVRINEPHSPKYHGLETYTWHEASLLADTPVLWLHGVRGCYSMNNVQVLESKGLTDE